MIYEIYVAYKKIKHILFTTLINTINNQTTLSCFSLCLKLRYWEPRDVISNEKFLKKVLDIIRKANKDSLEKF